MPAKAKFRDDLHKLKFHDDFPTLKFRDDFPTLKFRDDLPPPPPTLKFRDDGGSFARNKAVNDVKPTQRDVAFPGTGVGRPAPFVLSTPHHSMAWAKDQPGVLEATAAHLESELTQLSEAIAEREQALQQGLLTPQEEEQLQQLRADYEAVLVEYQQLLGGSTA